MREEANSSPAAGEYFAYIVEVMRENEKFIHRNARVAYEEVIECINDAIDEVGLAVKRSKREEDYLKHSMTFFAYHVLMPFSYAIYLDLLAGNVPACFMQLRLMLESLAKCYLADSRHPEGTFFQAKLELLEQEMERTTLSTSRAMKELGETLGIPNAFISLWGRLSHDWVHTRGFTEKLLGHVAEQSDMPPWALAIPMKYTQSDLTILEELRSRISQFRSILAATMEKHRQGYNSTGQPSN